MNQCTGEINVAYPGCQVLWSCMFQGNPPPMNRDIASWAGSSGHSENSSRPREIHSRTTVTTTAVTAPAAIQLRYHFVSIAAATYGQTGSSAAEGAEAAEPAAERWQNVHRLSEYAKIRR